MVGGTSGRSDDGACGVIEAGAGVRIGASDCRNVCGLICAGGIGRAEGGVRIVCGICDDATECACVDGFTGESACIDSIGSKRCDWGVAKRLVGSCSNDFRGELRASADSV